MQRASQLAPGPIYQPGKPVRNPQYKRFVKRFACAACGTSRNVDPCHTGAHAYGRKGSDMLVIPLCRKHHDEMGSDPRAFEARYQLDIAGLIATFNDLWELKMRKTA